MEYNTQSTKPDKLEIIHLTKSFGTKAVFSSLDFSVKEGEFLSILGSSGCGKTTILRILIGLLQPSSERIIKDGVDITSFAPVARNMGIVFQNYALFENMTVLGNVEYVLRKKKSKTPAKKIAHNILAQVGLEECEDMRINSLSGGQQQRVAIARTLVLKPDIILFDEPMSDRIMVMSRNKIHQLATPLSIMESPADSYVKEFVVDNLQRKVDSLAKYVKASI